MGKADPYEGRKPVKDMRSMQPTGIVLGNTCAKMTFIEYLGTHCVFQSHLEACDMHPPTPPPGQSEMGIHKEGLIMPRVPPPSRAIPPRMHLEQSIGRITHCQSACHMTGELYRCPGLTAEFVASHVLLTDELPVWLNWWIFVPMVLQQWERQQFYKTEWIGSTACTHQVAVLDSK